MEKIKGNLVNKDGSLYIGNTPIVQKLLTSKEVEKYCGCYVDAIGDRNKDGRILIRDITIYPK